MLAMIISSYRNCKKVKKIIGDDVKLQLVPTDDNDLIIFHQKKLKTN